MTTQAIFFSPSTIHHPPSTSTVSDYLSLLKPGVMLLVVFSGATGMWLAPGFLHPFLQAITVLCIAMGSGAGGALNMWYDRDIDARMLRTSARPIPAGRIRPGDALAFGVILAAIAVALLGLAVNWLAAGILAFAIFFYAVVYTMALKRRTPQNIVIGGAAGAFPPVIGWVAVTGDLSWHPVVLFLIIFLWTPPHFWALALYRSADYAHAGVPMLPVTAGITATSRQMLAYTLLLLPVTLLPALFGWQGLLYAGGALIMGGWFAFHALRVWTLPADARARAMFGFSILYLFALFGIMLIDQWFHMINPG